MEKKDYRIKMIITRYCITKNCW